MPINQSDFNRNGVFIIEENNSIVNNPIQEAIINFVPGFSKKSKTFNRPILLRTTNDRLKQFGDIDRNLEKKGSYFHRTLDYALQAGPVFAMNLLKTNELDTLNYASISVSAQFDNSTVKSEQYDSFFNKSGFWTRDVESFLFFAKNNENMVHFTNLSDKKVTIFMYKSSLKGYDVTLEQYYGSRDKVPTYLRYTDLVSDYLVKVIIVSGDYTNYSQLTVDTNMSKYFNPSGLIKTQIESFIKDKNVTTLGNYDVSLIPFFKDYNKNNIFIETVINNDTDNTGVFCAFDIDAVETDLPNGKIDIIGQTLANSDKAKINFMSYQDTINEVDVYTQTSNNRVGNIIAFSKTSENTDYVDNTNGSIVSVNGVSHTGINGDLASNSISITYDDLTAVINNKSFTKTTTITIPGVDAPTGSQVISKIFVTYMDVNGNITSVASNDITTVQASPAILLKDVNSNFIYSTIKGKNTSNLFMPNIPNTAIVLQVVCRSRSVSSEKTTVIGVGVDFGSVVPNTDITNYIVDQTVNNMNTVTSQTILNVDVNGVVSSAAFIDIVNSTSSPLTVNLVAGTYNASFINNVTDINNDNVIIDANSNDQFVQIEFKGSKLNSLIDTNIATLFYLPNTTTLVGGTNVKEVIANRAYKLFVELNNRVSQVTSILSVMSSNLTKTFELESATINATAATAIANAKFKVILPETLITSIQDIIFYIKDDKFSVANVDKLNSSSIGTQSQFYRDFINGRINSGDYFYENISEDASTLTATVSIEKDLANKTYIVFENTYLGNTGSSVSNGAKLLINNKDTEFKVSIQDNGQTFTSSMINYTKYLIAENLPVNTYNQCNVYDINRKISLKMFTVGVDLNVIFEPSIDTLKLVSNQTLNVYSGESSYTQTIEIVNEPTYTMTDTKILIDADRYSEVKVGDYLKAFIDTNSLELNETPKEFTRIIKRQPWSGNTASKNYVEITTDSKIDVTLISNNSMSLYQTKRYTTLEVYVDTYKGYSLNGFNVQSTSVPDGTEERLNEILNIVQKGSNLFSAITNKEKFNFRYLVDSFGLGLTANSKQQLVDIAGKRKNCLALINMPSIKQLKRSQNPSFINEDGTLNTEYLKNGGNLDKNPGFLYSFATKTGEIDGTDCSAYYFPYVNIDDNGRPTLFPPASFVLRTYMKKVNSNVAGKYPWTIGAGVEDGAITGIGDTEQDFTEDDLINLDALGANLIVYAKDRGFYIENEYTASRLPQSALSFIHNRETLIELENELFAMLKPFNYKFNNPQVREAIKRKADEICQSYVDRGALTFFINVIDETNNTPILLNNQFGLLETFIEFGSGMAKLVNKITAEANGALSGSSGFGL